MWVFLGMFLALAGGMIASLTQIGNMLAIGGGVLILFLGLGKLGYLPNFQFGVNNKGRIFSFHQRAFQLLIAEKSPNGKLALGLLNGLLPCGLSYAILVRAALTGSPISGALTMLSFGLGTVPALLLTGLVSTKLNARMRALGEGIAVAMVIFLGCLLILRGLGFHLAILHPNFFGDMHQH